MSYVTIYRVESNGDVVEQGEASNNHAGAPLVWQWLAEKHGLATRWSPPIFQELGEYKSVVMDDVACGRLFDPWPHHVGWSRREVFLLGSTFDRVWVRNGSTLVEVRDAWQWFLDEHVVPTRKDDRTSTGIIRHLTTIIENEGALGAAFHMCSATESFWETRDEETEEYRPFNVCIGPASDTQTSGSSWELSRALDVLEYQVDA